MNTNSVKVTYDNNGKDTKITNDHSGKGIKEFINENVLPAGKEILEDAKNAAIDFTKKEYDKLSEKLSEKYRNIDLGGRGIIYEENDNMNYERKINENPNINDDEMYNKYDKLISGTGPEIFILSMMDKFLTKTNIITIAIIFIVFLMMGIFFGQWLKGIVISLAAGVGYYIYATKMYK